jgi:hypothetical protein
MDFLGRLSSVNMAPVGWNLASEALGGRFSREYQIILPAAISPDRCALHEPSAISWREAQP